MVKLSKYDMGYQKKPNYQNSLLQQDIYKLLIKKFIKIIERGIMKPPVHIQGEHASQIFVTPKMLIYYTYATMMTLMKVMPSLKKIQKIYKSCEMLLEFC